MADKRIDQLVAATTLGNNDLLVVEQNNQAKKLAGSTLASFVYNAAGEKIEEVEQAVADAQSAVDSLEDQKDEIAQSIADMAQYGTDTTLSTTGVAADAKAAGDRIKAVETDALAGLDQAEITGVSIASFDDGADDVPVKSLLVDIKPAQNFNTYNTPWAGGCNLNILPNSYTSDVINDITFTVKSDGSLTVIGTASAEVNYILITAEVLSGLLNNGTTYYFSGCPSGGSSSTYCLSLSEVDSIDTGNGFTREFSGSTLGNFSIKIASGCTISKTFYPQIVASTSAVSWSPYENNSPISGFTEINMHVSNINIWDEEWEIGNINLTTGENTSANDRIRTKNFISVKPGSTYYIYRASASIGLRYYDAQKNYFPKYAVTITSSGTITIPSDAHYLRFTVVNATSYNGGISINYPATDTSNHSNINAEYQIAFPLNAGTVYGGLLDVSNGILTVDKGYVDLGTLTWTKYTSSNNIVSWYAAPTGAKAKFSFVCSRYTKSSSSSLTEINNGKATSHAGNQLRLYVRDDRYSNYSPAEVKTAMSGVQLVYDLAEPIIYTLTPAEVKTLVATNNIWSEFGDIADLIYRRKPISDADIQEQINAIRDAIAEREDTVIASTNYVVGSLIFVEDKLVEVTNLISTGETIAVGTNCQETTIAAQIAYLKSFINDLGNLAYLSYENV